MANSIVGDASRKCPSAPQLIADTIARAVTANRPKTRLVVGFGVKPMIFIRRLLFDRIFYGFIRMTTAVSRTQF